MIKTRIDKDANYKAIFCNGNTLRFKLDESKPMLPPKYPEFYDVAINSKCYGNCDFCYVDAKSNGKNFDNVCDKVYSVFGPMDKKERPFQVACLEENEFVATNKGMKRIGDIVSGDIIVNDTGNLSEVKNIVCSKKETIKLIGNKGFSVISTPDHLFQLEDGSMCRADATLNKKLNLIDIDGDNYLSNQRIDLAPYINKSSKVKGKRGGSSGGLVKDKKVRLMHTLPFIPRYIDVNKDFMWLYGLVAAEGHKRGISLHKDEVEYANKAIRIYNKITGGLGANVRKNGKNGIVVEFKKSKVFRTIFFESTNQSFGAKNKNFNFCFDKSKELVKWAIIGLFDGDGCYREGKDKRYNNNEYSAKLKVSSEKLTKDVDFLLRWKFGIHSSFKKEINPKRKIENRILDESTCYSVSIHKNKDLAYLFPDRYSEELYFFVYNKKSLNAFQDYIKIENIIPNGKQKVVDISLNSESSRLFSISSGVIVHNCGGAGEPTLHPQFIHVLQAFNDLTIVPNYTTNGMHITDDILDATEEFCDGVAVSCHPHLNWQSAMNKYAKIDTRLNLHIIISDKKSIDNFMHTYDICADIVEHFVLLPYMPVGRAKHKPVEIDYLFEKLRDLEQTKIAFGAHFYNALINKKHNFKASLYEPEMFSTYVVLDNPIRFYPSSFSDKRIKIPRD